MATRIVENGPERQRREKRRHRGGSKADEPLGIRERIRNQWEVVDQERRFVEAVDQSVRYALIVFGVTNTAVILLLTRSSVVRDVAGPGVWAVRIFGALYTVLALTILRDALRSLRPRLSAPEFDRLGTRLATRDGADDPVPISVLPMGTTRPSDEDYHAQWQRITGEDLSRQLSLASLALSGLGDSKNAALRKLYAGVTISLAVTGVLVATLIVASAL